MINISSKSKTNYICILLITEFLLFCVFSTLFLVFLQTKEKICFLASLVGTHALLIILRKKKKRKNKHILDKEDRIFSTLSHQELLDKTHYCLKQTKKYRFWTLGCLMIVGMGIPTIQLTRNPLYCHPLFSSFFFLIAFLIATVNLEKELELDEKIINFTLNGLEKEKNSNLKDNHFNNYAKSFQNKKRLFTHIFIKIFPSLIIFYSAICGISSFLFLVLPGWMVLSFTVIFMGIIAFFLGSCFYKPYLKLGKKVYYSQLPPHL